MSKTYWIKLYVEMLDDPKVGLLPDAIKWRWVSVLLQAGEMNEGGFLPDINDMAWRFHTNPETLQGEMRMLAGRGLAELRLYDDGSERWFLPAFAKRQAALSSTERSRLSRRKSRQNEGGDDNATIVQRNAAKKSRITDTETDTEADTEAEVESGASAPPHPRRAFRPVPDEVKRAKARMGIQDGPDVPGMISNAPLAIQMLERLTTYMPSDDKHAGILERLGDAPDEVALAKAVEMWRLSNYRMTNWLGIADWYVELLHDPDWTPQKQFKRGNSPPGGAQLSPSEQAAAEYAQMKRQLTGRTS